jgi:hypothetical protein
MPDPNPALDVLIAGMAPAQREGALRMLDAVSRPLLPREIELLLRAKGVTRSRAQIITAAVKTFHLIALLGPEDAPAEPVRKPPIIEIKRRVLPRRTPNELA